MCRLIPTSASLDQVLVGQLDVFICSASFENRCLVVPRMVKRMEDACQVLICRNVDHLSAVRGNFERLDEMFGDSHTCELSSNDPIGNADHFVDALSGFFESGSTIKIGVDITTFTRESLLILLRCLVEMMRPEDSLLAFYNRAASYEGVGLDDQWLSRGVREIRSVLGYSGDFMPTRRTHLVMLAGFEDDRAFRLAAEVEPTALSLGLPDAKYGHAAEHDAKMSARRERWLGQKDRWLSHLGSTVYEFNFHGYSVEECMQAIEDAVGRERSMNTVLAAMNTKISTVAAGLFALRNRDVQVSYAQAEMYNYDRYSSAADDVYVCDLRGALEPLWSDPGLVKRLS